MGGRGSSDSRAIRRLSASSAAQEAPHWAAARACSRTTDSLAVSCLTGAGISCRAGLPFLGGGREGQQTGGLFQGLDFMLDRGFEDDELAGPERVHALAGPKGHRATQDVQGQRPRGLVLRDLVSLAEEHKYEAACAVLAQGNRIASTRAPGGLLLEPLQVICEPHMKEGNPNRSIESRRPGVSHDLLHPSPREGCRQCAYQY